MKFLLSVFAFFMVGIVSAQLAQETFELRYFTNDPRANGETDFKGETEWMNTNQRIRFLNDYADYASRFFKDPDFDKKIVNDKEIHDVLDQLKPQPATNIRRTISLDGWKASGYKEGEEAESEKYLGAWLSYKGTKLSDGSLIMNSATVKRDIDTLTWRFRFNADIKVEEGKVTIAFCKYQKKVISVTVSRNEVNVLSADKMLHQKTDGNGRIKVEIEGDFTHRRFNLILNDKKVFDFIPMADTTATSATEFLMQSNGQVILDDLFLMNYAPLENVRVPYFSTVVLDEDFEKKTDVEGWQKFDFDDSQWKEVDLPSAHGGIREKEEDYYLRKKIHVNEFEKATLKFETIDPGGEVWVNDHVVAVINNRRPVTIDITRFLNPYSDNILAVRVYPYRIKYPMGHTPADHYTGWFLGRGSLLLTNKCMIRDVLVNTLQTSDSAKQANHVIIQYEGRFYFHGSIEINYYPWFPEEGKKVASVSQKIDVKPRMKNQFEVQLSVPHPDLWSSDSPCLYRVEVILKDQDGNAIDDFMTTTGIRTLDQKDGDLFVNGKREMLNGAQIMGFRTPIETISKNSRCAPPDKAVEELLMIKKMGGNLLRMHVHAEKDTTDGINDPRYAEWADQLGIYLIWQTSGWERQSEAWHVDFEGYPQYMRQVYNHPAIVLWEAGNHPNLFKEHDLADTQDYVKKIYNVIYAADSSRLISPTSYWEYTQYGNYDGTLDYQGNKIKAVPEFMAKNNTRGGQDAYTGYGRTWTDLRKAPSSWAGSCLAAHDKAYFNFEHEESIGQPNWNLCKGKPWYLLQSYEWYYDEGSIGRKLTVAEWKASQAWQAFSAWESMKKQILLGYDGFSWCTLHGGANMGTYKKPLTDNLGHAKLAFYANKMVFQRTWGGSDNVDVVYGPEDKIRPVINHLGDEQTVDVLVQLKTVKGKVIDEKKFKNLTLNDRHSFTYLDSFRFKRVPEGIYVVGYKVVSK